MVKTTNNGIRLAPNSANVELTRGCNMRCDFCGIHSIPKEIKYMTVPDARKIAKEYSVFDPMRIEYGMRGEPTLNPDFLKITHLFRRYCKDTQITCITNGIKLTPELAESFFRAGGNILFVDAYGKTYFKYKEKFEGFNVYDYYEDDFNPYYRHGPKTKALVLVDDVSSRNKESITRMLHNQGNNVDYDKVKKYGIEPIKEPLKNRCIHPFRRLEIFFNGDIPLCCMDWKGETVLWNVVKQGNLEHFWMNDTRLNAARYLLYHKNRNFGLCKVCSWMGGMRQGILPKMPDESPKLTKKALNIWNTHHKKQLRRIRKYGII